MLYCGKAVDGVYDKDPRKFKNARRYDEITYDEVILKRLEALDQASVILCRDRPGGGLPVFVFELSEPVEPHRRDRWPLPGHFYPRPIQPSIKGVCFRRLLH